jgi:hypothetical protein
MGSIMTYYVAKSNSTMQKNSIAHESHLLSSFSIACQAITRVFTLEGTFWIIHLCIKIAFSKVQSLTFTRPSH